MIVPGLEAPVAPLDMARNNPFANWVRCLFARELTRAIRHVAGRRLRGDR